MRWILFLLFSTSASYGSSFPAEQISEASFVCHMNMPTGTNEYFLGNYEKGDITGTVFSTDCPIDGCRDFNGTNNFITFPLTSVEIFAPTEAFHVSAWVKMPQAQYSDKVIATVGHSVDMVYGYGIWNRGVGWLGFVYHTETGYFYTYGNIQIDDGKWHYVVANYGGCGSYTCVDLFVDGIKNTRIADQTSGLPLTSFTTSVYKRIGARRTNELCFDGYIDEVIFGRGTLSQAEILYRYKGNKKRVTQ